MKVRLVGVSEKELKVFTESKILEAGASKRLYFARQCWKEFQVGTVSIDELHGEVYSSADQPHRISIEAKAHGNGAAVIIRAL